MEPYNAMSDYLEQGKYGALATIVSRVGAAPRHVGAKVFIGEDGRMYGTIGGGCVEAEVSSRARAVIASGEATKLRYTLNGTTVDDEGMICGGSVEVLIEPVSEKHKEIYRRILECLACGQRALAITRADDLPFQKALITEGGKWRGDFVIPNIEKEFEELFCLQAPAFRNGFLIEPVSPPPHLYIYGAGHISQHISKMAKMVEFNVTVIDDRAYFANEKRFPEADNIAVGEFTKVIKNKYPIRDGYVVIVTRGHKHDAVVLEEVLKRPPRYVGMIGSKRKVKIIYDDLIKKGVDQSLLRVVHAPIGIDIDAETPQEIAVSIVAELIKARSNRA